MFFFLSAFSCFIRVHPDIVAVRRKGQDIRFLVVRHVDAEARVHVQVTVRLPLQQVSFRLQFPADSRPAEQRHLVVCALLVHQYVRLALHAFPVAANLLAHILVFFHYRLAGLQHQRCQPYQTAAQQQSFRLCHFDIHFLVFLSFVFLYNYFSFLLRAAGDSVVSLVFLGISSGLNIVLDLALVYGIRMGIKGAAIATVISQIVSGIGICIYTWMKMPELRFSLRPERIKESQSVMGEVVRYSAASSIQQSVMNFGILMIQGLVNSFGTAVMAAFAAAVKIDSFAYMPAQEFANAFSIFISQNRGAGKEKRVQKGVRSAVTVSAAFCICASVLIYFGARYLMLAFIDGSEHEIIRVGIQYLHIEGAFYCGIGILFLWYGYYRAVGRPEMSVVLTVISLGTRVLLSYTLAPIKSIGVIAIWWSIPIGWFLADVTGYVYLQYMNKKAKMCRN